MIFQKQSFKHNPPHSYGDCQRTVYACLLDMNPTDIPNFGEHLGDSLAFWDAAHDFLASKGWSRISIVFQDELQRVLDTQYNTNPGHYYILSGQSKNGTNHVVICLGNKIIWDPAIDNSGIVAPCDDGYYWVEYLVPLFHKKDPHVN